MVPPIWRNIENVPRIKFCRRLRSNKKVTLTSNNSMPRHSFPIRRKFRKLRKIERNLGHKMHAAWKLVSQYLRFVPHGMRPRKWIQLVGRPRRK